MVDAARPEIDIVPSVPLQTVGFVNATVLMFGVGGVSNTCTETVVGVEEHPFAFAVTVTEYVPDTTGFIVAVAEVELLNPAFTDDAVQVYVFPPILVTLRLII